MERKLRVCHDVALLREEVHHGDFITLPLNDHGHVRRVLQLQMELS
jgi:hypothetical protein